MEVAALVIPVALVALVLVLLPLLPLLLLHTKYYRSALLLSVTTTSQGREQVPPHSRKHELGRELPKGLACAQSCFKALGWQRLVPESFTPMARGSQTLAFDPHLISVCVVDCCLVSLPVSKPCPS